MKEPIAATHRGRAHEEAAVLGRSPRRAPGSNPQADSALLAEDEDDEDSFFSFLSFGTEL